MMPSIKSGAITNGKRVLTVNVGNFGLAASAAANVTLTVRADGKEPVTLTKQLSPLAPYAAADIEFDFPADPLPAGAEPKAEIRIDGAPDGDVLKVALTKLP